MFTVPSRLCSFCTTNSTFLEVRGFHIFVIVYWHRHYFLHVMVHTFVHSHRRHIHKNQNFLTLPEKAEVPVYATALIDCAVAWLSWFLKARRTITSITKSMLASASYLVGSRCFGQLRCFHALSTGFLLPWNQTGPIRNSAIVPLRQPTGWNCWWASHQ